MRKYIVVNTSRLSSDVVQLTLQPKHQSKALQFYPGQYACIGFRQGIRPTPMRCFSIVSSPNEQQRLQFAMRQQGQFTATAAQLQPGTVVSVGGPFGDFVIDQQYDHNVVMMAGGIGITPYISTLRYATEAGVQLPITLFYSCRGRGGVPFFDELVELERRNPYLRVIFFVTDGNLPASADARMVNGRIDDSWIARVTGRAFHGGTYFLCGPKGFVHDLGNRLRKQQVDGSRILTESFAQASVQPVLGGRFGMQSLTFAATAAVLLLGFGFVSVLDLARTVPHLASLETAQIKRQPASATTVSSTNTTTSSNDGSSTAPSTTNNQTSTASPPASSPAPSASAPTYQYQPPVTSMS